MDDWKTREKIILLRNQMWEEIEAIVRHTEEEMVKLRQEDVLQQKA